MPGTRHDRINYRYKRKWPWVKEIVKPKPKRNSNPRRSKNA